MKLTESAVHTIGSVFFNTYKTKDAKADALSVLKILDFNWNSSNDTLIYENTGEVMSKESCSEYNPFQVVPFNNISSFDLDCLEKVLNTRFMKGVLSPAGLSPLFECLGWKLELSGDTYRLHFVGGTDYWESKDPKQWDKEWTDGWKEPWVITKDGFLKTQEEIDKSINNFMDCLDKYLNEEDTDENEEPFDWDPNGEIPKEWI